MGWALAPGVGFCFAGDQLIFLDLSTDRYLALRGERRAAFERLRAREENSSDAMAALLATGFFVWSEGEEALDPVDMAVPKVDLATRQPGRLRLPMIAAAARHLYWARKALAPARLASTVAHLRDQKRTLASECDRDAGAMAAVAADYAAARTLVPVPPRCLVDSLALLRLMIRQGLAPTMVFAVRPAPFAAHCWLQSSATILTGSVDDAHNFTPILVI